jgi:hypothetical protein
MSDIKRFRQSRFREPGIAGDKRIDYSAKPDPGPLEKLYKYYKVGSDYQEKIDKIKENYENVKGLLDKEERAVSILKLCEEWLPEAIKMGFTLLGAEEVPIVDFFMKFYKPHFMILEDLIGANAKYETLQELKKAAEEKLPTIKEQADPVITTYSLKGKQWSETLHLIGEWNVNVKLLGWMLEHRQSQGLSRVWASLNSTDQKIQQRVMKLVGHAMALRTVMDQVDDLVEKRKEKLDSLKKQSSIGSLMGQLTEQADILDEIQYKNDRLLAARAAVKALEKLVDQWIERIDTIQIRSFD